MSYRDPFPWGAALLIVLIIAGIVFFANGAYQQVTVDYRFDQKIGDYFENADRASSVPVKLAYFDKFVLALQQNDLTSGQSTIWFQKPTTDLAYQYNVTLSLQTRLKALNDTCTAKGQGSQDCSFGLSQISLQEFCWFPIIIFKHAYELQQGAWGFAVMPASVDNRCASSSSSSGTP